MFVSFPLANKWYVEIIYVDIKICVYSTFKYYILYSYMLHIVFLCMHVDIFVCTLEHLVGVLCCDHRLRLRSRASTGRSKATPMGSPSSPSARLGNLLAARTLVLLLVAASLGVWVVVEQPSSSLMEYHVLFQRLLKLLPLRKLSVQMADFGADTPKPTSLYSSTLH